ncbi:hypothetical protein Tco_1504255, partial [Tanacetum coccineum]
PGYSTFMTNGDLRSEVTKDKFRCTIGSVDIRTAGIKSRLDAV